MSAGADPVTSDGTQCFVWDGADRLIQRGADTFSYDALSRLTSATVVGTTSTYTYDGDEFRRRNPTGAASPRRLRRALRV